MNIYHSETEQVEIIRQWFKQYGHWVSSIILAILLIVLGCRFWENHQLKMASQASDRYQQLMQAVADHDDSMIQTATQDLIMHFPKTVYAQSALLLEAKQAVNAQKWSEALFDLQRVMEHSASPALQEVARLRSARILLMQKQYTAALTLLSIVNDVSYEPSIDETKGDIYFALNDKKQAINAYQKAIKGFAKAGFSSPILMMKLNEMK